MTNLTPTRKTPLSRARILLVLSALAAAWIHGWGGAAHAQVSVDITEGSIRSIPVMILPIRSASGRTDLDHASMGAAIQDVVQRDLSDSGMFVTMDSSNLPTGNTQTVVPLQILREKGVQAALVSTVDFVGSGANRKVQVVARLWNVFTRMEIFARRYETQAESWRQLAHFVANDVFSTLTGEEGNFHTRIMFVAESGPRDNRIRRLAIMDQDGHNVQYLTQGDQLVLTPRFSPDGQRIVYLSIFNDQASVYLFHLVTGAFERIGDFNGMTFAPRFTPDGNGLLLSQAIKGNSDVYHLDLQTRHMRRLTTAPGVETSPTFSPDMTRIAFTSDRDGSPQIFVMDANGNNPRRISHGNGSYSTPVWSPTGELIAFTKQLQGLFYIGVMEPDGSGERLLARAYLVESPDWSPNGRRLVFFRQKNRNQDDFRLVVSDLSGYFQRELKTPTNASDPSWGP